MNGVIVVDKPQGFTSFDVVAVMRGLAKEKKIGHTGTLDPMATGVLPLLLGRAAKAADLLPDTDKEYLAEFLLGERYDTGDVTGALLERRDRPVARAEIEAALAGFLGDVMQVPPMYSAVSVNGKRLYQLARKGLEVDRPARPVHIALLKLDGYSQEDRRGTLRVRCSKGTYIRTLIEDIARAAGTVGAMSGLRRTRACGFSAEEAVPLDRLRELAGRGELESVLRPVERLFDGYARVAVSPAQGRRFQNGGALDIQRLRLEARPEDGQVLRVHGPGAGFLGLARADMARGELRFLKLFAEDGQEPGGSPAPAAAMDLPVGKA